MKKTMVQLAAMVCGLALVGCGTVGSIAEYKKAFKDNGYRAYLPPKGNPNDEFVRQNFGAGSVIRFDDGTCLLTSPRYITNQVLLARLMTNSIPTVLFSGMKLSGGDLAIEANLASPSVVKAGFSVTGTNQQQEVIKYGPTHSCLMNEDEALDAWTGGHNQIKRQHRDQVANGRAGLVIDAIWTESLMFRYDKAWLIKATGNANLKTDDKVTIGGKLFRVVGTDLCYEKPMFVGYKVSKDVPAEERAMIATARRAPRVTVTAAQKSR